MQYRVIFASTLAALPFAGALAQAEAFRSGHIGFTTASGSAGDQILIQTGYDPAIPAASTGLTPEETEIYAYRFNSGQFQTRARYTPGNPNPPFSIARFNLLDPAASNWNAAGGGGVSPVNGWRTYSGFSTAPLTSKAGITWTGGDFFAATGRLVGGNFAYELLSVTPLAGSTPASVALGRVDSVAGITSESQRRLNPGNATLVLDQFGVYNPALAGGGTLTDRSIFVGNGIHDHGWRMFVSNYGIYEVSLRVYDTTGRYLPSEAFSLQLNSVPGPGFGAMLGALGLAGLRRRRPNL